MTKASCHCAASVPGLLHPPSKTHPSLQAATDHIEQICVRQSLCTGYHLVRVHWDGASHKHTVHKADLQPTDRKQGTTKAEDSGQPIPKVQESCQCWWGLFYMCLTCTAAEASHEGNNTSQSPEGHPVSHPACSIAWDVQVSSSSQDVAFPAHSVTIEHYKCNKGKTQVAVLEFGRSYLWGAWVKVIKYGTQVGKIPAKERQEKGQCREHCCLAVTVNPRNETGGRSQPLLNQRVIEQESFGRLRTYLLSLLHPWSCLAFF